MAPYLILILEEIIVVLIAKLALQNGKQSRTSLESWVRVCKDNFPNYTAKLAKALFYLPWPHYVIGVYNLSRNFFIHLSAGWIAVFAKKYLLDVLILNVRINGKTSVNQSG